MFGLKDKVDSLGIKTYNGRYNGPLDLAEFAGVIHIPYAWSNLAIFEAIQLGIIYFIPSFNFLKEIKKDKDFFWSPPYREEVMELSEWYCEDFKDILIYFDTWDDLKYKSNNIDFSLQKTKIISFASQFEKNNIEKWKILLS